MISLHILSLAAALSASMIAAQDITQMIASLSGSCQSAAGSLLTSDFGKCANIMGLIPVISAPDSILGPFAEWVHSSCPIEACSDSTVAAALSSIDKGCADDLAKGVPTAIAVSTIISNYALVRQMICAQSSSNNNFCASTLFSNIEKATKKSMTITVLESILVDGFSALVPLLAVVPKEETCDDCGKELYIAATSIKPSQYSTKKAVAAPANSDELVSAVCGASFVDKKHPSSVRQAGSTNTSGAANATDAANTTTTTTTTKNTTTTNTPSVTGAHNGDHAPETAPTSSASFLMPSYIAALSLLLLAHMDVSA